MKKIFFLTVTVVVLFCFPAFSLDLAETTWGPEKGGHGFYLFFTADNNFKLVHSGEGGGQSVLGNYTISGNEITLNVVTINDWGELPNYIKQKTVKCSLIETDSLFSIYKLIGSNGLELWSVTHIPENNKKRSMDGYVIYSYRSNCKVNNNARVREGPGLQYKFYSFSFEEEPHEYNALPKGSSVRVLGYSEIKTMVDGEEHPWYYCVFRKNMWEEQFGWIWGGLIDF
ncbi:MAG: hypothetical protein FWG07_07730 [Treponema sp.]|nr:hypothetical protein [Treponema sp.]